MEATAPPAPGGLAPPQPYNPGGFAAPAPAVIAGEEGQAAEAPPSQATEAVAQEPRLYGPHNCPPGLEYLTQIDQILCKQKVELVEVLTTFETRNRYMIMNARGQDLYYAEEDTNFCTRNCCGPNRPFDMVITDYNGMEVIHLYRPLNCDSCCFPCCLQYMEVCAPPGNVVATIKQKWSVCYPRFKIRDASGRVALRIEGPVCTYSWFGADVEFKVLSPNGKREVGVISKKWAGLLKEAFTDADVFGITFPMDLDVRMKAALLGAMFLIDFMFFEKKGHREDDSPGML